MALAELARRSFLLYTARKQSVMAMPPPPNQMAGACTRQAFGVACIRRLPNESLQARDRSPQSWPAKDPIISSIANLQACQKINLPTADLRNFPDERPIRNIADWNAIAMVLVRNLWLHRWSAPTHSKRSGSMVTTSLTSPIPGRSNVRSCWAPRHVQAGADRPCTQRSAAEFGRSKVLPFNRSVPGLRENRRITRA